jgi:hypothetical protein
MHDAPSPRDLARQLDPLAAQLRTLGEPLAANATLPPVQQLLPLAASLVVAVQFALNTTGDPRGTGRANLEAVRSRAQQLARAAEAALVEEPT